MRTLLCIFGILGILGHVQASVTVVDLTSTNIRTSGIVVNTRDTGTNCKRFRVIVTPKAGEKRADWEGVLWIKHGTNVVVSRNVAVVKSLETLKNIEKQVFEFEVTSEDLLTSEFTLTTMPVVGSAFSWKLRLKDFVNGK